MTSTQWCCLLLLAACVAITHGDLLRKLKREETQSLHDQVDDELLDEDEELEPCECGVFMSQQIGTKERRRWRARGPPSGEPVITYETEGPIVPCGATGNKQCLSKCLDVIVNYLPRAGPVICGAAERDMHREKAYLYIRNCDAEWTPTSFSAGKEFCCTDGEHHKC